jgi:hypothetical protein
MSVTSEYDLPTIRRAAEHIMGDIDNADASAQEHSDIDSEATPINTNKTDQNRPRVNERACAVVALIPNRLLSFSLLVAHAIGCKN